MTVVPHWEAVRLHLVVPVYRIIALKGRGLVNRCCPVSPPPWVLCQVLMKAHSIEARHLMATRGRDATPILYPNTPSTGTSKAPQFKPDSPIFNKGVWGKTALSHPITNYPIPNI
jgi:hypothetical protein